MTGISSGSAHFIDIARALETQRAQFERALEPIIGAASRMSIITEQTERQLRILDRVPIEILRPNPFVESALATQVMLESMQRATVHVVPNLSNHLLAMDRAYAQLARPALAASHALTNISAQVRSLASGQEMLRALQSQATVFAHLANATMTSLAKAPDVFLSLSPWLQRAPSVEQYAATRVIEIELGATGSTVDQESEDLLDTIADDLEARLASIQIGLVEPYRGAIASINAQQPDWRRHLATSVRELVDHLILSVARDEEVESFHSGNPAASEDGKLTRRARLQYVFRAIAVGEYARMAEEDIAFVLATFYPANATVHNLVSHLTPAQMRVFVRRVQGCISTILEAAGH